MALDFPASPTVNQTYPTPAVTGVPVYTWDGEKWTTKGGAVGSTGGADDPPPMDGVATAGVSTQWAREDHKHPTDTTRYATTGGVITGDVQIQKADPSLSLKKTAATQSNVLFGYNQNSARWSVILGDNTAETGGNAGSDLSIIRYNDSGGVLSAPIFITRSTGAIGLNNTTSVNGLLNVNGAFNINGGAAMNNNTTYTTVYDSSAGGAAIILGGGADLANYFRNSAHYFQSRAAGATYATFTPTQFTVNYTAAKPGGGVWSDSSDARIKNVEGDYTRGLEDITKLRPVLFTYKGNDTDDSPSKPEPDADGKVATPKEAPIVPYKNSIHYQAATDNQKFSGLIAQEAETVIPELVTKRAGFIDGQPVTDLRSLDATPLIFALINAVKELKTRVEQLEAAP